MQPARRTSVTVSPGLMLKIRPAREGESWGGGSAYPDQLAGIPAQTKCLVDHASTG